MLKRLVATVFVSALAVLGLAPAASAAPAPSHSRAPVVQIIDWDSIPQIIDWDASPVKLGGGVVTPQIIDWD